MRNILIVEDEPFIAFDLEEGLQQAGFNVIAISKTTTDALCAIERGGFDGVVLDALLQGNSAAPIAHALRAKNVPFIVVSGYEMKDSIGSAILASSASHSISPSSSPY